MRGLLFRLRSRLATVIYSYFVLRMLFPFRQTEKPGDNNDTKDGNQTNNKNDGKTITRTIIRRIAKRTKRRSTRTKPRYKKQKKDLGEATSRNSKSI